MFSANAEQKDNSAFKQNPRRKTTTPLLSKRKSPAVQRREQQHEEWKESLRQACLNRARKSRKEVIWKKRLLQQTPIPDCNDNDGDSAVRSVVEQELRHQGVAVVTPGFHAKSSLASSPPNETGIFFHIPSTYESPDQATATVADTPFTTKTTTPAAPADPLEDESDSSNLTQNVLSEEEWHELLQEVEDEIRRSEEDLLEEILEQERCQELELEEEIAHYQEWEEQMPDHLPDEECVICPMCWEGLLRQSPSGDIACPNEACQFRLIGQQSAVTLTELKERLRVALENHSIRCQGRLNFELHPANRDMMTQHSQHQYSLVGTCHQCEAILGIT